MPPAEPSRQSTDTDRPPLAIEAVLQVLPIAAALLDQAGRVRAWNPRLECLLSAHAAPALVVGGPFRDAPIGAQRNGVAAALEKALNDPPGSTRTVDILWPEEGATHLRVTFGQVADPRGRPGGVLVSIEDLTQTARNEGERTAATEELRIANEELITLSDQLETKAQALEAAEVSDRQKNRFLAVLAHELRNPLASILGAGRLIAREQPGKPVVQKAVHVIDRQGRHLARLLDDLLDVARIKQGKIQLQRQALDLWAVIGEVVEMTRSSVARGRPRLSVALAEPLFVGGDHTRLTQMVANLLDNAVKYTPPDGEIAVGAWRDGEVAVIAVRDTGIGISSEMLPRIFDLFAQGDSSLAHSRGGLGIGLTLVRELAQLHGGSVEARSGGLGLGSEFTLRLPLVPAPAATPEPEPPVATALGHRRILVVEDNRDAREMLRLALELDGHQVKAVWDGPQAIEIALSWRPNLALVDIGLPGIDGYQVARRIREALGAEITLAALTGYGGTEVRERALSAGFDCHLVKPVEPEALSRLCPGPARPS